MPNHHVRGVSRRTARATILTILTLGIIAATIAGASATEQPVTANVEQSLSMSASATAVSDWALAPTGGNSRPGGSVTVSSNVPYSFEVFFDRTSMGEFDSQTGAYVSGGRTLSRPMTVVAARTGGTALVAATPTTGAVSGVSKTLATGSGGGTDEYSLDLQQPTGLSDRRLPSNRTYRIVLTYAASSTL